MSERTAIVTGGASSLAQVEAYMPHNYTAAMEWVEGVVDATWLIQGGRGQVRIVIRGTDDSGWTLDGYVIPRLASGLIWAREEV